MSESALKTGLNPPAATLSLVGPDKLTEFRFDEPLTVPTPPPNTLVSHTFGTLFVILDDPEDRVWLNGTVSWYINFTAVGTMFVVFGFYRDGAPIAYVNQSIFNPVAGANTVSQVAHLQFMDAPLAGMSLTSPVPVVYTFRAFMSSTGPAFTQGPTTFTAAEIEPE